MAWNLSNGAYPRFMFARNRLPIGNGLAQRVKSHEQGLLISAVPNLASSRIVSPRHPDQQLPEIVPLEHAPEGLRGVFQSVDDILLVPDLAVPDAGSDLLEEVGE